MKERVPCEYNGGSVNFKSLLGYSIIALRRGRPIGQRTYEGAGPESFGDQWEGTKTGYVRRRVRDLN